MPLKGLQDHLKANKHIKTIFFNKAGDWVFHTSKTGCLTGATREEVLSEDFEIPVNTKAVKTEALEAPKDAAKLPKDKEIIDAIKAAKTFEELETALNSDTRVKVVAAYNVRLKALNEAEIDGLDEDTIDKSNEEDLM